jgi:uncharacterized protein (TIGR03437 family)
MGPSTGISFALDSVTGGVDSTLAGTTVSFGGFSAPILYASATQVNAVVPYEVAGQTQASVQVTFLGSVSNGLNVQVANAAPSIFTSSQTGSGQAAAVNLDGTVNGPSNPVAAGSYVSVYFTGGGQTNPPGITGSITPASHKLVVQTLTATVGGKPAEVTFQGAAPTYIDGLNQLNLHLADDTPSGAQPVVIHAGDVTSQTTATVFVQ